MPATGKATNAKEHDSQIDFILTRRDNTANINIRKPDIIGATSDHLYMTMTVRPTMLPRPTTQDMITPGNDNKAGTKRAPRRQRPAPATGSAATMAATYAMNPVAKHSTNTDCWAAVDGHVLDVTSFLSQHSGGELAIETFADAAEEFNMIQPPDVSSEYAPESIVGKFRRGLGRGGRARRGAGRGRRRQGEVGQGPGDLLSNEAGGELDGSSDWRLEGLDDSLGAFLINVAAYVSETRYPLLSVLCVSVL